MTPIASVEVAIRDPIVKAFRIPTAVWVYLGPTLAHTSVAVAIAAIAPAARAVAVKVAVMV